jgi:hypothetical protein
MNCPCLDRRVSASARGATARSSTTTTLRPVSTRLVCSTASPPTSRGAVSGSSDVHACRGQLGGLSIVYSAPPKIHQAPSVLLSMQLLMYTRSRVWHTQPATTSTSTAVSQPPPLAPLTPPSLYCPIDVRLVVSGCCVFPVLVQPVTTGRWLVRGSARATPTGSPRRCVGHLDCPSLRIIPQSYGGL